MTDVDSKIKEPVLCIVNPDDLFNLKTYYTDDSRYCITPYEAHEMQCQGITFPEEPHLHEGLILTRNQNGNGYYFRTDETDSRIINERCLAIEAILSYLGGKEFEYTTQTSFRGCRKNNIKVGVEVKKGGTDIKSETSVNTDFNERETETTTDYATWSGEYTSEGYKRAVKIAEVNGLKDDPSIASLLEQRQPSHPNPITSREYHVNVTADLDKNIHILERAKANLKDKIGGSLEVDVNTSRKIGQSSSVFFRVSFGAIPQEADVVQVEIKKKVHAKSRRWLWVTVAIGVIVVIAVVLSLAL